MVVAEMLIPDQGDLGQAILERTDVGSLEQRAVQSGMVTRWERACHAVEDGSTSPAEVRRVLGVSD